MKFLLRKCICRFILKFSRFYFHAPTRVVLLFPVLLGIAALFRVGTPHSSIPLCTITFRNCQGETHYYITHAKVLSCLILLMFCLLVVNIYLSFLKIKINSPIMLAKSFNPCIAPCNCIIAIYISITSILTTQVLLKSGDIETNPGPKNHLPSSSATGT